MARGLYGSRGFVVASLAIGLAACGGEATSPAPEPAPAPAAEPAPVPAARVFFVEPAAGARVTSPVKVVMGVEGMVVKPAGELVVGTGHHHIIVDGGPVAPGSVVPADAQHIHYGAGQTETELTLDPGPHTLRLQFADGMHQSYGEALSAQISIEVVAAP